MTEKVSFTNVYCAYIQNKPHGYPGENTELITVTDTEARKSHTGWQIIPNILWQHYVTPKQWAEFTIKYQSYHVEGASCTVFNPIPITTSLALQRTNTFAAFNNCTYCLGYTDDLYETYYHPWYHVKPEEQVNLFFKEGIYFKTGDGSSEVTTDMQRFVLPPYYWKRVNSFSVQDKKNWGQGLDGSGVWPGVPDQPTQNPVPAAVEWDPLNRPDSIMELRAGKNAITFNWTCHESDKGKFVNMDQLVHWTPWTPDGPYIGGGRPGTKKIVSQSDPYYLSTYGLSREYNSDTANPGKFWDYTVPNWSRLPIVPMAWFWKEMQESIIMENPSGTLYPDLIYPGTEREQYMYPPTQWFIKGIPLLGSDNQLIETTTMCAFKISLHLQCKPRKSAIFAPTWGPFAWRQLYSHNKDNYIFQPSMVRYRTAGMRRTWQNRAGNNATQEWFPREPPYTSDTSGNSYYPLSNRPRIIEEEEHPQEDQEPSVSFSKAREKATIRLPERPPRRSTPFRAPSQSEPADVSMMRDIQMG